MLEVANYDVVFTKDPDNGEELLLLAIERTDVPESHGAPTRVQVFQFETGPALRLEFEDSSVLLPQVPDAVFPQLTHFSQVWVCWMDEGDIVDDIQIPLAA